LRRPGVGFGGFLRVGRSATGYPEDTDFAFDPEYHFFDAPADVTAEALHRARDQAGAAISEGRCD